MRWFRLATAMALASGAGCIPADSNIVGPATSATSATCTPACGAAQRCVNGTCVGDGLFRFTLTWDQPGDVDLHVVVPSGSSINYRTRSGGGGMLDRDDQVGRGPENVFWNSTPPLGEYLVCVIPFAITRPTNYVLDVRLPSGTLDRRAGTVNTDARASTASCSRTSPFFVVAYTIALGTPDAGIPDAPEGDAPALPDVPAVTDASALPDLPELADLPLPVDAGDLPDAAAAD
ncbi:MAG: hypothetical protein Q8S73_44255 [Deltaproteobacteria bacterium]|nr:hypothetical protein [Myxococcales bacterium]MDP3221178.1 hypothetical protein [Deltaproteobacteria bacterium]